jgi:hypothetical protein
MWWALQVRRSRGRVGLKEFELPHQWIAGGCIHHSTSEIIITQPAVLFFGLFPQSRTHWAHSTNEPTSTTHGFQLFPACQSNIRKKTKP